MQHLIPRKNCLKEILACLKESPVTVLLGPRQIGKTFLARLIEEKKSAVTFFDLERNVDRAALITPELTLEECRGLVIIDEIQRLPELFRVLRPLADRRRIPARFLLLGSASPTLVKGVSESLAGRVLFVKVGGFSLDEVGVDRQKDLWLRGGFPRAFIASSAESRQRWFESFVATFLEQDIPQLGISIPGRALHRFWLMLAHYHGQILNSSELGRSLDISSVTVRKYLDILEGTFMVRSLAPWHENLKKRQVKSPKIYIRDSGLFHHLMGISSLAELRTNPRYGASWEGFALEQVLLRFGQNDAYFWASQRGAELDLLLLRKGRRYGFEFKCSDAPTMTRSMHIALDDLHMERLFVIYPGSKAYPLHPKVEALPLAHLWKNQLIQDSKK